MNWIIIMVIFVLVTLTAAADRMIGLLLCVSLLGYTIVARRKATAIFTGYAIALFSTLLILSFSFETSGVHVNDIIKIVPEKVPEIYRPSNLIILFVVVDGLLLVPATLGFLNLKNNLLKIPLLVSLAGSFSWLVFSENNLLVADRWIILSGIFLSIFAAYGIIQFLFKKLNSTLAIGLASTALIIFAAVGLAYTVLPYSNPFILYGAAQSNIGDFVPVTMQFNSLDIKDNGKLLSIIDWINKYTEPDAVIVGGKHWRGSMELYLEDQRIYRFSDNPKALAEVLENQGYRVYEFKPDIKSSTMFVVESITRGHG